MVELLWVVIGILCMIIILLFGKIYMLRKAAREILASFSEKLATDTNTLIDISSGDKYMGKLTAGINEQLRLLRKQRQKYLNGDRELKEAVTNISHDLRTPLTAICGYLDLLEEEEKSEEVTRYLSMIENRAEAMKHLTEEMFRYSMILSTEEELKPEEVCVNAVLEEAIAGFYGALTERGIEPEIEITENKILWRANKEALSRVFGNVLNNALKYSDGDLKITLSDKGDIIFSNTASGLDEVQVGRLFDRFFSVEAARNSTGLGLAISKTLVEQMGGNISAEYRSKILSIYIRFYQE